MENKENLIKAIKTLKLETKLYLGGQIVVLILSFALAIQALVHKTDVMDIYYICVLMNHCLALFCIRESCSLTLARFSQAVMECDMEMNPPLLAPVTNFKMSEGDLTPISFLIHIIQLISAFITYFIAVRSGQLQILVAVLYVLIPAWWTYEIISVMKRHIPDRDRIKKSIIISGAAEKISKYVPEGMEMDIADAKSFKSREEMEDFIKKNFGDDVTVVEVNDDTDPEELKEMISKEIELDAEEET